MANPTICRLLGADAPSQLMGKSVFEIVHPDYHEMVRERWKLVLSGQLAPLAEEQFIRLDGTVVDVEVNAVAIDWGGRTGVQVLARDITERKRAEEALRESEGRYKLMFESSPLAINITHGTEITYANPSYLGMFGFATLDELKGRPPLSLFAPEWRPKIMENSQRRAEGLPVPNSYEVECLRKDGTRFPVIMNLVRTTFADGPATVGFIIDITERKRAEEALRNSQARLDFALQSAEMGVWHWDIVEDKRYFDGQVCCLLGINPATFTGAAEEFFRVVHPDDLEGLKAALARTVEQGARYEPEYRAVWPDGSVHDIVARGNLDRGENGRPLRINGILWDITERRRAEDEIRQSEEKYHDLYRYSALGIFHSTFEGKFIDMNAALSRMLGYDSPEEAVSCITNIADQVYAEPPLRDSVATAALKAGGIIRVENIYRHKDGTLWNAMLHLRVVSDQQGKPSHYEGFVEDITARKQAEENLKQALEWREAIFEGSRDAVFISDQDSHFVAVNDAASELTGYSREQLLRMRIPDLHEHPDLVVYQIYSHRIFDGEEILSEAKILRRDGRKVDTEFSNKRVAIAGKNYMHTTARDVTERRKAEQALRESEVRFRTFVEQAPLAIFVTREGNALYANQNAAKMLGLQSVEGIEGWPIAEMIAPQYREESKERTRRRSLGLPVPSTYESLALRADGSQFPVQLAVSHIELADGGANIAFVTDITERKRAEEKVLESEESYRVLGEASHDLVIKVNRRWEVGYTNEFAARAYGTSPQNLIGKRLADIFPHETADRMQVSLQQVFDSGQSVYMESPFDMKVRMVWLGSWLVPIKDRDVEAKEILVYSRDITERKRAEEALRKSEAKFRAVVENSHDGILFCDANAVIHYRSPSYKRINGFSDEERIGHSGFETADPDDLEGVR